MVSTDDTSSAHPTTTALGRKLHLGCGAKYIPGFYHVDIIDGPHIDRCGHVDDLTFLGDGVVDLLYACHVLEHFGRYEVETVLREWHRVLRGGGVLRLSVPDFAAVVKMYGSEGLGDGMSGLIGLVSGGQRTPYDFHKMIFDEPLLTALLRRVGFADVRHWDWRHTEHTYIDDYSQAYLPHLDKKRGQLMSLNLEAVKG
jgi:predicted SAM-dependent methyltransferase